MKRLLLIILTTLIYSTSFAQFDSNTYLTSEYVKDVIALQMMQVKSNRYKIYPTENIYNFLKLDTQTGCIEQVQWSLDDNKEFITTLNNEDLSLTTGMNSFELYPTQNMYQFLLLDKSTGRTWHVQWGLSDNKRWIKRIF